LIRSDILAGQFDAGGVLLETALGRRYGVSRTPVREALGRLEQDGLLRRAVRGYVVRSGTPEDVLEIYEARIALESAAAFGAARRRSDLDLARLSHLHSAAGSSSEPGTVRELHSQWHEALWRAGHNGTIESLLGGLLVRLRIYDRAASGESGGSEVAAEHSLEDSQAEHAVVVAAISAQDAAAARDALAAHLARSRDLRLAAFAREP
jgi:DNA-binding GntR family transcriptional regulator